ncbi:MAG: RHS repeat-associated core domain-containing protein [Bacteroidales bacterium]|jgi:RHS repeat-associated protein|nr:RHS repeat-associated core domain-containing protein [Bacteroidales bacterium]
MKNRIEEITKHYYTGNHLSSTQLVTDGTGVAAQQVEYAPFGEVVNEYNIDWSNGQVPDFKFNAKELDEENGMYYFEARYQSPPVFISRDPLFEKYFWMSPYAYCGNNPLKYIDPTGMDYDPELVAPKNGQNGQIIIHATYYATESDEASVCNGADRWNQMSGQYQYNVINGENIETYDIIFDIQVQVFENADKRNEAYESVRGNGQANLFQITNEEGLGTVTIDGINRIINGQTEGSNSIVVAKNAPNRTSGHEIGHTLGLPDYVDDVDGLMSNIYDKNKTKIKSNYISNILNRCGFKIIGATQNETNYFTPKRTYDMNGELKETKID